MGTDLQIPIGFNDQQMPHTRKIPNAETLAAMVEADEIVRQRMARFANDDELFNPLKKDSTGNMADPFERA